MSILTGEKSLTKIAALFPSEEAAQTAAHDVARAVGLSPSQARLLFPEEAQTPRRELFAMKVEPESDGITQTFWRSHLALGALGAFVGALLWWVWREQALIASTPVMSLVALVGFGATFGLLAGGLVTLRPDQVQVISALRTGLRAGQWAVVFHPFNSRQAESIHYALQSRQIEALSSL